MKKFIMLFLVTVIVPILVFSQGTNKLNVQRSPIGPNSVIGGEPPVPFVANFGPESFESAVFPPAGWTKLNPIGGTGWDRITNGVNIPGWGTAVIASTPPGGGSAIIYATYTNGGASANDMWIITPQITNIDLNDSLIFWVKKWPGLDYADNLDVKISTTTNSSVAAFTYVVANLVYPAVNDTTWQRKGYRLGNVPGLTNGANIYIGFREHVANNLNDGDVIGFDLISLVGSTVGINQNGTEVPSAYDLSQNYPNPFNPSTKINFSLPKSGNVKLAVYDMVGNEVAVITNGEMVSGNYTADFDATKLASGVYFYTLVTNEFTATKRMILVK